MRWLHLQQGREQTEGFERLIEIFHQLCVSLLADVALMSRESKEANVSYKSRRQRLELADSRVGVEVYLLFFGEVASDNAQ